MAMRTALMTSTSTGGSLGLTLRAAAPRLVAEVGGAIMATNAGGGSLGPGDGLLRESNPGITNCPGCTVSSPPVMRNCGPAENPACCEALGVGIWGVAVGTRLAIARDASEGRFAWDI